MTAASQVKMPSRLNHERIATQGLNVFALNPYQMIASSLSRGQSHLQDFDYWNDWVLASEHEIERDNAIEREIER